MEPIAAIRHGAEGPPGASESLEGVFARWEDELLGTLYYLLGNLDDAKEALQETFVKCWRHRDEVPGVHNLRAWVFRIALNTGRDMRAAAWRRRRKPLPEDVDALLADPSHAESDTIRREQVARLRSAVAELRQEEQEVFLLRQNGQLKYEEIAESLGIPIGTVKTRMRLAIGKLRLTLGEG